MHDKIKSKFLESVLIVNLREPLHPSAKNVTAESGTFVVTPGYKSDTHAIAMTIP